MAVKHLFFFSVSKGLKCKGSYIYVEKLKLTVARPSSVYVEVSVLSPGSKKFSLLFNRQQNLSRCFSGMISHRVWITNPKDSNRLMVVMTSFPSRYESSKKEDEKSPVCLKVAETGVMSF